MPTPLHRLHIAWLGRATPWPPGARLLAVALAALALSAPSPPASAREFGRVSAGMGYGLAGLFHDEYVAHSRHSSDVGEFTAGSWSADVGYLFSSRWMIGARLHGLRADLGDEAPLGQLDVLPVTAFVAYRRPALAGDLGGFIGAGIGRASVRFLPADSIGAWLPREGDRFELSTGNPLAVEFFTGVEYRLSDEFALETSLSSTWMDCEIGYRPAPIEELEEGFAPQRGYVVKARHLAISVGLRWWVEWW